MASTYSTSLQIQLIGNGEQSNIWGTTTNTNWNLIEQAVAGVVNITMVNANYTLTVLNGVSDEARNMVLVVGGNNSAIRQVIAPLVPKVYVVYNNTIGGYAITIGGSSGALVTVPNGVATLVYCDGTNFFTGISGVSGNFNVPGNLAVTGNETVSGSETVAGNFSAASATLLAYTSANFTGSISGTTLTVSAVASGALFVGQRISGTGVTSGTQITALGTGTGGTGTYTVSASQTASSTSMVGSVGVIAPTMPSGDSSTNVATTAFVQNSIPTYGTLAAQNANNVDITGGAIYGTSIGGPADTVITGTIDNGSGSAGTTLTVSSVANGAIYVGQILSGSGVTSGTTVTAFVSGSGGTGTYTVSASQLVSSTTIKGASAAATFTATISNGSGSAGTILNVTAVASGTIRVGQKLYGTGVTAGTIITAVGTGTGGTGTYTVDTSQNTSSTTITSTGVTTSGSFTTASASSGFYGNLTGNVTGNASSATTATTATALTTATGSAPSYAARAWSRFNSTSVSTLTGTYSQDNGAGAPGTIVVVAISGHGMNVGDTIYMDITSGSGVDGYYVITATTTNTFTYTALTSLNTGGNCQFKKVAVTAAGNVNNIIYVSAGNYVVNFTTALPDGNYALLGSCAQATLGLNTATVNSTSISPGTKATLITSSSSDRNYFSFAVFD